jgi:hypothetical protein
VARLAAELEHRIAPRFQLLVVMVLAGAAAFLTSVLLLWAPGEAYKGMGLRYATAAVCGYLAFVALIRVWIALHRPAADTDPGLELPDPFDVIDIAQSIDRPPSPTPAFGGGRSGGGGASTDWSSASAQSSSPSRGSWGIDLDLDGVVWLAIAAGCAAAGLVSIGYVIYMAPVLLAEVALDAAIISVLYRRLRRDEQGYWLTTVLSNTWIPALVLVVFAFIAGYALQQIAPDARSIGGVLQSFSAAAR